MPGPIPERIHLQPVPPEAHRPGYEGLPALPPPICQRNRRFHPDTPKATPADFFTVRPNKCTVLGYRFIRKGDKTRSQALFFIDGSCLDNGSGVREPRGGCAVVFGPRVEYTPMKVALELDGTRHTGNRAELRAALVALGMRFWPGEGFDNIVLATDSEYLVNGIADRVPKWMVNGWKTSDGKRVANRDMWEALVAKIREIEARGCHVQFWAIPHEWNEADIYAKEAAAIPDSERTRGPGSAVAQVHFMEKSAQENLKKYGMTLSMRALEDQADALGCSVDDILSGIKAATLKAHVVQT